MEGKTSQVWCSKACYVILYPQKTKEIKCGFCPTMFVPRNNNTITCGSEECKKKRNKEYQREKLKDPEFRKRKNRYNKKHQAKRFKDPEYKERHNRRCRENARRRLEDPEYRERYNQLSKKYREEHPEYRERLIQRRREKREDPEYKKKERQYQKEYYLRTKEKDQ